MLLYKRDICRANVYSHQNVLSESSIIVCSPTSMTQKEVFESEAVRRSPISIASHSVIKSNVLYEQLLGSLEGGS